MNDYLKFYEVNKEYIEYLKKYEKRVPNISYENYDKFLCGIVLRVNELNYFTPVSHFKKQMQTNILIQDDKGVYGSLRFSFMFPIKEHLLTELDIFSYPKKHQFLLNKEYQFCLSNHDKIRNKAEEVYSKYKILPFYKNICCNFPLLEEKCREYEKMLENQKTKQAEEEITI